MREIEIISVSNVCKELEAREKWQCIMSYKSWRGEYRMYMILNGIELRWSNVAFLELWLCFKFSSGFADYFHVALVLFRVCNVEWRSTGILYTVCVYLACCYTYKIYIHKKREKYMCVHVSALKTLLWSFFRRKWGERWEGCLHKLMWGDRLPHCAWVPHCLQCLQTGSCLKASIFVSTGCGDCQIIIDASLESIRYSTNTVTVLGICGDRVGAK